MKTRGNAIFSTKVSILGSTPLGTVMLHGKVPDIISQIRSITISLEIILLWSSSRTVSSGQEIETLMALLLEAIFACTSWIFFMKEAIHNCLGGIQSRPNGGTPLKICLKGYTHKNVLELYQMLVQASQQAQIWMIHIWWRPWSRNLWKFLAIAGKFSRTTMRHCWDFTGSLCYG